MMKFVCSILLVLFLLGVEFTVEAQVKINFSNAGKRELLGVAEALNVGNRKMVVASSKTETLATLELEIPDKCLCVLGYKGKLHFLWADKQDEFSINCTTEKMIGGDKRIQAFLTQWQTDCFDSFTENALFNNLLYATGQLLQVGKRQVDARLFLASDYPKKLDAWREKQENMLEEMADDAPEFVKAFSVYVDYIYWDQLVRSVRLLLLGNMEIPVALSDKVLELPVEEVGFTKLPYSDLWLSVYVDVLEARQLVKPTLKDYVYRVATYFRNPELREYYVLSQMKGGTRGRNTIFFRELFEPCRTLIVSEEGKKKYENWMIQAGRTEAANHFDGQPALELSFRDYEGKERCLSDYRGKFVYIDFWATWCGPCKQETPYFVKLAERMKGKNIVCLSLSVDRKDSEQAWKKYVDEHGLREYCEVGWTGSGFSNVFVEHYGINAIPRFMLVGPDGEMIHHDCWRPSNVQIDELLNLYLK